MEKKDNVEKGVSGKPEEKKSAAYYEKRPEFGNRGPSKILLHFWMRWNSRAMKSNAANTLPLKAHGRNALSG